MKPLIKKHSSVYIKEVLLETLQDYDIEYNIIRYINVFYIIIY